MGVRRLACAALLVLAGCSAYHATTLLVTGHHRDLRERFEGEPDNSPSHPALLVIAIDGVDRALLYAMLRRNELPGLAALLGSTGAEFPHAYFDDRIIATLPSSTLAAWTTAMTGVAPAVHGVTGNEFFIRNERRFAAPAPVSFDDATPVLETYTDDYVNALVGAPTVYEQIRARDPDVLIWVAMHQVFRGADRLVLTRRTVLVDAFQAYAEQRLEAVAKEQRHGWGVFETLDKEVIHDVVEDLQDGPLPDVLTVYVSGTDLFAHVAEQGPDAARRAYLREVLDPLFVDLRTALAARGALDNRYVIVTADHGHTQVLHDDVHALGARPDRGAPALLGTAGFRVRPLALHVDTDADFNAVVAYGGALAYIYLADRSTCPAPGEVCDWSRPPRFHEDVLTVADAFYTNNVRGAYAPELRGTLDMVLARRPHAAGEPPKPFEVYVGRGRLMPVADYLRAHPHRTYVDMPARLAELAAGPHGDNAGDVLLVAHDGDRDDPAQRFYFAVPYHSWHGSPSRRDSAIPLIVAHPHRSTTEIGTLVRAALGDAPRQQRIADVLLSLRFDNPTQ